VEKELTSGALATTFSLTNWWSAIWAKQLIWQAYSYKQSHSYLNWLV